jgi:hypothetical protein
MPPKTTPVPPVQLAWKSLPAVQQRELAHLLARLLYRYLTADKVRAGSQKSMEMSDEQPSPHQ